MNKLEDTKHKYEDIIYLNKPISKKHKEMSLKNRAAQFAPFAAVVGHSESVNEVARLTNMKLDLDEQAKEEINRSLNLLLSDEYQDSVATFVVFKEDIKKSGGEYIEIKGKIKRFDEVNQVLHLVDKRIIKIDNLIEVII